MTQLVDLNLSFFGWPRLFTKSRRERPPAAFGGSPPFQGESGRTEFAGFTVPLEKGDSREAAGGRSPNIRNRLFVQCRSPRMRACLGATAAEESAS
jgi:hypothetical protein